MSVGNSQQDVDMGCRCPRYDSYGEDYLFVLCVQMGSTFNENYE